MPYPYTFPFYFENNPYNALKHDVGFNSGGSTFGLMLHRKNDIPVYEEYDDEPFAEQRTSGDPGYGWYRPGVNLPMRQDSFRQGLGLDVYDSSEPERYFAGYNIDTRFKNMVIQGPKATAVTRPTTTAVSITNADMETATSGWSVDGARSTDQAHGGTYSWKVLGASDSYQDLVADIVGESKTEYRGRRFTFSCYVWSVGTTAARLILDDGVGTTNSSTTTAASWVKLTVTRRLDAAATRLRLILDSGADNTAYFDDAEIIMPDRGNPVAFEEHGGQLFCAEGNVLSELDENGDAFNYATNFPHDITDIKAFTDGNVYIALGDNDYYWYLTSTQIESCDTVWTELIDVDVTASADSVDKQEGAASLKLVVAAGVATDDILATQAISSTDMSGIYHITMRIKSSVVCAANDLQFLLDETAKCASPDKTLSIPALEADTWRYVALDIGHVEADSTAVNAIISIGIKMHVDKGAFTLRVDDIRMRTFTESTDTQGKATFFQPVGLTIWKAKLPRALMSATDPTNPGAGTNWAGATNVDSTGYNITDLLSFGNALYIMKEDRPFYLDSVAAVQILTNITAAIGNSTSGKNVHEVEGKVYMPWGDSSLLEYDAGTFEWRDPSLHCSNLGAFDGRVMALAHDEWGLYAAVDNSTKVEILAGRLETVGGSTAWAWHGSLCEITLDGVETMFTSNIYEKRLWIASTLSSDILYYIKLYQSYGDVTNDNNRNFDTTLAAAGSCYLETSYLHGDFKAVNKALIKIALQMEDITANIYWEAHYKVLGGSYVDIGDFNTPTTTSPVTTKYLAAAGTSRTTTMVRLKFVSKTNSATVTPVLKGYNLSSLLYADSPKIIRCTVEAIDAPMTRLSVADAVMGKDVATHLTTADARTWPCEFYDPWWGSSADTRYVKIINMHPRVKTDAKGRNIGRLVDLTLQEVTLA